MTCYGCPKSSDFWLSHTDARLFATSQWPVHRCVYLAYRAFLAVYLSAWLIFHLVISTPTVGAYFVFLTNWTFTVFTLYAVSSCFGATYFTFVDRMNIYETVDSRNTEESQTVLPTVQDKTSPLSSAAEPPEEEPTGHRLPPYLKLVWLLFNICLTTNPIITVIVWVVLTPPADQPPLAWVIDINDHVLNTVFLYVDLFVSSIPVRSVHFVYAYLYLYSYILFTLVYYWAGGVNPNTGDTELYRHVLDWSNAGRSVLSVVLISAVVPLVHVAGYGGYKLRIYIHRRYFE